MVTLLKRGKSQSDDTVQSGVWIQTSDHRYSDYTSFYYALRYILFFISDTFIDFKSLVSSLLYNLYLLMIS